MMTTEARTQVSHTTVARTTRMGVVLAGVLALLDVVGGITQLSPDALIPIEVSVMAIVLGVSSLAVIPFAWRGSAWAIWLLVAFRALSALGAVPAFFVPDVPAAAVMTAALTVVVTIAAIVLLLVRGGRR